MRKFSNPYKTKNAGEQAGHFGLSLLQWLRLLVLSFTRIRNSLSGIFFHEPGNLVLNKMNLENTTSPKIIDNKKLPNMKPAKLLIKWGLMLLLTVCVTNAMAQAPPAIPGNHSVCANETKEYGVPLNVGSTYAWSITPNTGFTLTPNPTYPNLITVTWTTPGVYTMQVIETNAEGCVGDPATIIITVNPLPTATVAATTPICSGGDAVFTITGTAGDIVTYNINGGASQTVTIGATGTATVTVPAATADQTINLVSVSRPSTTCTQPVTGTATVAINPLPTATVAATTPICSGGDAVFTITGTAGDIVTYNINGGASQTVTIGATGTATVTVPAATADQTINLVSVSRPSTTCTQPVTGTATVAINPLPTATVAATTPICSGGDAVFTITGTAGDIVTYNINGGASQTVTIGATGTATVTVPAATADQTINLVSVSRPSTTCTQPVTGTATVAINPLPTATVAATTPICSGGDAVFTITGTAGDIVTYNINGGASQTVTIGATGTATVTVPAATADQTINLVSVSRPSTTCTQPVTGTATVAINPLPTATVAATTPICSGGDAVFTITGTAGDIVTYNINGGASQTVTIGATGTATVTVPAATADQTINLVSVSRPSTTCTQPVTGTATVAINPLPTATVAATTPICSGGDAVFTITGTAGDIVTYNINGGASQTVTIGATGTATVTVPAATADQTINLVSVSRPSTTCTQPVTGTATVAINPLPTATVAATTPICSGGDAVFTITGTAGDIVTYNINGGASQTVTIGATGTATVTVPAATADQTINLVSVSRPSTTCTQPVTGTATVAINPLPTATVAATTPICSGGDAVFTITGTAGDIVTYNINGGASQTVTIGATGTATVTVPAATADQTINLVSVSRPSTTCTQPVTGTATVAINPLPTATVAATTPICSGGDAVFTITGTAGDIVTYNINGGASQTVTIGATGTATVTVPAATADQTINLVSVSRPSTTCTQPVTGTATVAINPLPTATVAATTPICSGGDAVFTITGTAGDIVTYNINGGASQTVTIGATGTATVTVPAATADQTINLVSVNHPATTCTQTLTASVIVVVNPLPNPVITGPDPMCVNSGTATYTTPQVGCNTYSWTVSAGGTIIGSNTGNSVTVQWTTPGTKTVTVTETMCVTGCSRTVSKDVIVTPKPVTTPITHN